MKQIGALVTIAAVSLLAIVVGLVSSQQSEPDEADIFAHSAFTQIRAPLTPISSYISHGQISVNYIKHISDTFHDRFAYTPQEMLTAAWLAEELLAMGYEWNDIDIQAFSIDDMRHITYIAHIMDILLFIERTPFVNLGIRTSEKSQNIILTVPGQSEKTIVVGAHYDGVFFPGASDNASGVALLLESAQRMLIQENYYTIEYVFFGAEEVGLLGSYYYVDSLRQEQHDNMLFMINADVLLDGDELFYMAGYDFYSSPGANHITETWDYIANEVNIHHGFSLTPLPWGVFGPSDQLAFLPFGHTAMFLAGLTTETIGDIPDGDITPHMMDMSRVLHTQQDDIHYIMETWPDKAKNNMRAFSLFLEELLLAKYT